MKGLFVFFTILFVSCGAEPEHTSLPQPLVFDDLSIRQASDILVSAGTLSISDEMIEEYYKGKALDPVARLEVEECFYNGSDEDERQLVCGDCSQSSTIQGSGFLTSPSRIMTAHHVVGDKAQEIIAIFQIPDFDPVRSAPDSENYLLALRLYSLGLIELAHKNQVDARESLRVWEFFLERSYHQPFNMKHSDVAILLPEPKVVQTEDTSFVLPFPGMLFDSIGTAGNSYQDPGPDEPVAALSIAHVPENVFMEGRTSFLSTTLEKRVCSDEAFTATSDEWNTPQLRECVNSSESCLWNGSEFVAGMTDYRDCFSTSVDSVKGMSGGAMMMSVIEQDEETKLRAIGTIHSVTTGGLSVQEQWELQSPESFPVFDGQQTFATKVSRITSEISNDGSKDWSFQNPPQSVTDPVQGGVRLWGTERVDFLSTWNPVSRVRL